MDVVKVLLVLKMLLLCAGKSSNTLFLLHVNCQKSGQGMQARSKLVGGWAEKKTFLLKPERTFFTSSSAKTYLYWNRKADNGMLKAKLSVHFSEIWREHRVLPMHTWRGNRGLSDGSVAVESGRQKGVCRSIQQNGQQGVFGSLYQWLLRGMYFRCENKGSKKRVFPWHQSGYQDVSLIQNLSLW